jgi:hypothetical protein
MGTSTIVVDVTTTIDVGGSVSFNNLTFGASRTITVTSGVGNGFVVNGALASEGTSGTKSVLVSDIPATAWEIDLQGTSSLTDNVNVTDSNAAAGNEIAAPGSTDGGGNTNWSFTPPLDRYFVGDTDSSWNDTANWASSSGGAGGASIPGALNPVFFDANSPACNIDVAALGLSLDSTGYASTLTQDATFTLTISGAILWAAGTFAGGDSAITVATTFTLTGGTFNAGSTNISVPAGLTMSGGTFNGDTGTITLTDSQTVDTGAANLNNLTLDTIASSDDITITGTTNVAGKLLILEIDNVVSGTIALSGDLQTSDSVIRGAALVRLVGSVDQKVYVDEAGGTGQIPAIEIASVGGTVTFKDTLQIPSTAATAFTYTSGTVDMGTSTIGFYTATTIIDSGGASVKFNNVEINLTTSTRDLTVTGIMDIDGNLTITRLDELNGGTIELAGDLKTVNAGLNAGGPGIIKLDGAADQKVFVDEAGGAGAIPGIEIASTSGTVTFKDIISVMGGGTSFLHTSGTVDMGTSTIIFKAASTVDAAAVEFNNVTVQLTGSNSLTVTGTLDVNGTFTLTSANNMNGGTINLGGNVVLSDSDIQGTAVYVFDGTGDQTLDATGGGEFSDGAVSINKASGSVTLLSALTLNGVGQNFTVTKGNFDLDGFDLSVAGTFLVTDTLTLKGDETLTNGTTTIGTASTVIYKDSAVTAVLDALTQTYFKLVLGAGKTHNVTAGVGNGIQVNGVFSSNGSSSNRSILRSTIPGTDWELDLQGISKLGASVNVSDSDASAGNLVVALGSIEG